MSANCLLRRQFAWNVKAYFFGYNKKNNSKCMLKLLPPPPQLPTMLSFKMNLFIPADGSTEFKAEAGRYHMYVSLACPWAHQASIVRKLKGLEDVISTTVVDWFLTEKGWSFTDKVFWYYSITSMARIRMARSPWLIRTRFWVPTKFFR